MIGVVRYGEFEWVLDSKLARRSFAISSSMEELSDGVSMNGAVVRYGDRVLVASARLDGVASAVYEFVDDDRDCDSRLGLIWVGSEIHEDAGHALEACMNWCRHN